MAAILVADSVAHDAWLEGALDHRPERHERRPLHVYSLDPSVSLRDGAIAVVKVPLEPLAPGPVGRVLRIDLAAPSFGETYRPCDLEAPDQLRQGGYQPDAADPRFHAQMAYAIGSILREGFCSALGRTIGWAGGAGPLTVKPFALEGRNAYYSREKRAVGFGFFRAEATDTSFPEGRYLFTSLSSDVQVHEFAHALLDVVRPLYLVSTNADLLAFHEAFGDILALLQRFEYPDLVRAILRRSGGSVLAGRLFQALAPEFAQAGGLGVALRTFEGVALQEDPVAAQPLPRLRYGPDLSIEPHERGRVLTEAIMEAFGEIVERRVEPLVRIAGGASAAQAPSAALLDLIVQMTTKVAGHFRTICIRALDFCPPMDLELGEYLRAIITADLALVPDDPYNYREALVAAFRRRALYPRHVETLSVNALKWGSVRAGATKAPGLALSQLNFRADPASPPSAEESLRQGALLAAALESDPDFAREAGLRLDLVGRDGYGPAQVAYIRPTRRIGPKGQLDYDLVAQVVQSRSVRLPSGGEFLFWGGATLHFDAEGVLSLAISRRVDHVERQSDQARWVAQGRYWTDDGSGLRRPLTTRSASFCGGASSCHVGET